jgi:hypothetical protein
VYSSLYGIYFVIHEATDVDGQILSLDSCASSVHYTAKTINFNGVIDESATVNARKVIM